MKRMFTRTAVLLSLGVTFVAACSQDGPGTSQDIGIDADTALDIDISDVSDSAVAVCGDDRVDAPYEQCEPSVPVTCADANFAYGTATCTDDCRIDTSACDGAPICGDGSVDGDEACDDGNGIDGDGCNADCTQDQCGDGEVTGEEECDGDRTMVCADGSLGVLPCSDDCTLQATTCLTEGVCGDGELNAGEACDDGNDVDADGCDTNCVPTACGNGVLEGSELCDGNAFDGQSCTSLGFSSGTLYCSDTCRLDTERCEIAVCGDGRTSAGEACDDGNRDSGDGCSRDCVVEYCGDGRLSTGIGEQCDGSNVGGVTCANFGYVLAPLQCSSDCSLDLSDCEPLPFCGDGLLDDELGEECDDGNAVDGDGCTAGCLAESCGDGIVQSAEACEPGVAPSETCVDQEYVAGVLGCDDTCAFDVSACLDTTCGNGVLDDNEVCDGSLSRSACLDEGFDFGRVDCTDNCELDTTLCRNTAMCGDGQRAGSEECDDGNFTDGDGCSLDCLLEFCGDGIVQPALDEACDGASVLVTLGCGLGGSLAGTVACEPNACTYGPLHCEPASCGNTIIERGEACDDGNLVDDDGCDSTCRSETCGDGVHQTIEACDGDTDATCDVLGVSVGTPQCVDCAIDYSFCGQDPICGNGFRERGEECDDGNAVEDDDCNSFCTVQIPCAHDEFVQDNDCVPCAAGLTNGPGDNALGPDTECEPLICTEDEFVSGLACIPCGIGQFNDAGDDATMGDTTCDQDVCSLAFGVRCDDFNQAYIKASTTDGQDWFGYNVSLSADGSTLAVGAHREDSSATGIDGEQSDNSASNSGAVYVFVRDTDNTWTQQAYIKASNTDAADRFGNSISLSADGDTLAVVASEEDSSATGVDGNQTNNDALDSGAVYVFVRDTDNNWSQQAYIKASNTGVDDSFGWSVCLSGDGDTLAVGARGEDSFGVLGHPDDNSVVNSGAVYVFARDTDNNWSQQAFIKASNPDRIDYFGHDLSLSADGNTLVVGANSEDSAARGVNGNQDDNGASNSGAVYIFVRDTDNNWNQQAYIKASNSESGDGFGAHVSLSADGNTLAVAASGEDSNAVDVNGIESSNSALSSGAVYVFVRDTDNNWSQQAYIKASNTGADDRFGISLSLSADGNTLAVGAHEEDGHGQGIVTGPPTDLFLNSGAVYVFARDADNWSQRAYLKASNTGPSEYFGFSQSLSADGTTLAIGAYGDDSSATGIDGDQGDSGEYQSGAVHVRLISDGTP